MANGTRFLLLHLEPGHNLDILDNRSLTVAFLTPRGLTAFGSRPTTMFAHYIAVIRDLLICTEIEVFQRDIQLHASIIGPRSATTTPLHLLAAKEGVDDVVQLSIIQTNQKCNKYQQCES